jgi:hypothetical protein
MAGGTPVVAFDIGHLPALIGHGGPREHGHLGLWRAAREPLTDPLGYERTSRVAAWQARIAWIELEHAEADDVIATVAHRRHPGPPHPGPWRAAPPV